MDVPMRAGSLPALAVPGSAGPAKVLDAQIRRDTPARCRLVVTVRHDDSGWDHCADARQGLAPDGSLIARRNLRHPHENEQPFTRSLDAVALPADIDPVIMRATAMVA